MGFLEGAFARLVLSGGTVRRSVAPFGSAPSAPAEAPTATFPRQTSSPASGPSTAPPVLATAPIVTSAPLVLYSNLDSAAADVAVKARHVGGPEAVPPPYKGNRSVVRAVIDSTGPIGRRPVIVAGVLISVLLGIAAFRLEERTHILQRIQEWRHFENM